MFLKVLTMNEKKAFICIANELMLSNGYIDEQQSQVHRQLLDEMEIQENNNLPSEEKSFELLRSSKNITKRSIYIELVSLSLADNVLDISEKEYLRKIEKNLGLPDTFTRKAILWYKQYMSTIKEGLELVEGF